MTHPAEETKEEKSSRLKDMIAKRKGKAASKSNGKGSNGQSGHAKPAKAAPKKAAKKKAAPKKTKAPAKKTTKKAAPKKESTGKRQARAKAANEPIKRKSRSQEKDGLFQVERDIIKIVRQKRGKPIAIKEVAFKLFGSDVVNEAETQGAGEDSIRTVRNGVRMPIQYGYLRRWTKDDDPDAKAGFVCFVKAPEKVKPGAADKGKAKAKKAAKKETGKAFAAAKGNKNAKGNKKAAAKKPTKKAAAKPKGPAKKKAAPRKKSRKSKK